MEVYNSMVQLTGNDRIVFVENLDEATEIKP